MNSLQDLNTYGTTSIEFDDDRPAKVVFNLLPPLGATDVAQDITTTSYAVSPTIEIAEIINYTTANVRYRVTINDITGATISFGTLSGNLTLDTSTPGVYEISGFTDVADWNTARAFTWNLPVGYASDDLFWLDVEIIYYDEALGYDVTTAWKVYDPDNYYIAKLESAFTSTSALTARVDNSAALFVSSSIALIPDATLESNFSLTADVDRVLGPINAPLNTSVSLTANAVKIALNFIYADTETTSYDTEGNVGMFDEYIVTGKSTGLEFWTVDSSGIISSYDNFNITTSDENSGNIPFSPYDVDVKVKDGYLYACQSNSVTLTNTYTSGSIRVYRRLISSGSWSKVLDLKGSNSTRYNACKYHLANNGYHYLLLIRQTSSNNGATWGSDTLIMYRSTNGTSWSSLWTKSITQSNLEKYAMSDTVVWYMPFDELIGYNISSGSQTFNYTNSGSGYGTPTGNNNNVIGVKDNICVVGGDDGHRVVDLVDGSILSSQSSISSGAWDRVRLTNNYVALFDYQNAYAIYKTSGDYGAKVATTSTSSLDIALSLYGMVLRSNNSNIETYK